MARTAVIIGGGVAGLVAARTLAATGARVVVLEQCAAVGGALASGDVDGVVVDLGAEAYGVTRRETADLVSALGLDDRVVAPRRSDARLLLPEGLFAMPPALLGIPSDLVSPALIDIAGADAVGSARILDARPVAPVDPTITLGALVRMRLGEAIVSRVLVPVVGGVHAAHPDHVEAEAVLPGILAAMTTAGSLSGAAARMRAAAGVPGAAIAGLQGGMTTLVRALAADLAPGTDLRCGVTVTRVERTGPGWVVRTTAGDLPADDLVLAVDAPAAARLLAPVPSVADALSNVAVGDVALVAVAVRSEALDADPVGSGVLVAPGHPRVRAKAMTHASAKWDWVRTAYGPGHHLVRLSYGRDGVIDEPLDDLPAIAAQDLAAITGISDLAVTGSVLVRWDRSVARPAPGPGARVAAVRGAVEAVPHLAVVGAGLGGNGLAGTIATARSVADQLTDA